MAIAEMDELINSGAGIYEKSEAAHLFCKAIDCLKNDMPNRAHRHIRASKRSTVDKMVESDDRNARKFWHKCYLLVEELEIYIRRRI